MKKYLLGICAIALAIGFSSYRPFVQFLYFVPSNITELNVEDGASYQESSITCSGVNVDPCQLDLTLITDATVTNEAQLLSYLAAPGRFANDAERVQFIKDISVADKP